MNLLHFSDPQFGKHHREGEGGGPAARLLEHVLGLGVRVDLVALTGDVAEWSMPAEYTAAFDGLDPERVARYGARDVARLLRDERIIRSEAKVRSAIGNARAWCRVMERGGTHAFRDLVWEPTGHRVKVRRPRRRGEVLAESPESRALSRALKRAGFSFCGPVICHAYMQAVGCVNEHLVSCFRHAPVVAIARRARLLP